MIQRFADCKISHQEMQKRIASLDVKRIFPKLGVVTCRDEELQLSIVFQKVEQNEIQVYTIPFEKWREWSIEDLKVSMWDSTIQKISGSKL